MALRGTDWISLALVAAFWVLLTIDFIKRRRRVRKTKGTGLRKGLERLTYRGEHRS